MSSGLHKKPTNSQQYTFAPMVEQPKPPVVAKKKPQKLEEGFDKKLLELEFSVEKCPTAESVAQLVALYNTAITHYDTVKDKSLSEIFRVKVAMLFAKPSVMQIYGAKKVCEEKKDEPSNE